jgi:hypothetical protein
MKEAGHNLHLRSGKDYIAEASSYGTTMQAAIATLDALNQQAEALYNASSASNTAIALALQPLLNNKQNLDAASHPIFIGLRGSIQSASSAEMDLHAVGLELKDVEADIAFFTAAESTIRKMIDKEEAKEKKQEIEDKHKASAERLKQVVDPADKLAQGVFGGKAMDSFLELIYSLPATAIKENIDHYYSNKAKKETEGLVTKISQLASGITLAQSEMVDALEAKKVTAKEKIAEKDKKANKDLGEAMGQIAGYIDSFINLTGADSAEVRAVFVAVKAHLHQLTPMGQQLLAAVPGAQAAMEHPFSAPAFRTHLEGARQTAGRLAGGECTDDVDPEIDAQEEDYAVWEAQAAKLAAWCDKVERWERGVWKEIQGIERYIRDAKHLDKVRDAIDVINSYFFKGPKLVWPGGGLPAK